MKKFLKSKLILAVVVVAMLFGIATILSMKVPVMARTSCGQVLVKASDWLGGLGVDVRSNGADMNKKYACDPDGEVYNLSANPPQYGFGWLSVELVNRLYVTKGWSARLTIPATYKGQKTYSGAKWLYTLAAARHYPNLVAHANASNYKPVPGDMIVHSNGTLGHVTVVDHISGNTLYAVDQNRSPNGWESYTYNSSTGAVSMSGVTISGYVHSTLNRSIFHVSGTLPANETWTSNNIYVVDSQLTIPNGITLTIDPGTIVKVTSAGLDVQKGGALNATGTSTNPIIFTSYKDDSIGGDSNGDGNATTPAVGDYGTAIRLEVPASSDVISYIVFKYASSAISIGAAGTLNVDHSQFTHNQAAFDSDTTSTNNPVLGTLASNCLFPYANSINISDSWFGSTGKPGTSMDLSGYIGLTLPDGYPGLSTLYSGLTQFASLTGSVSDNTLPWTLFTCGIPDGPTVAFPVTPVYIPGFIESGIAESELWTQSNLAE